MRLRRLRAVGRLVVLDVPDRLARRDELDRTRRTRCTRSTARRAPSRTSTTMVGTFAALADVSMFFRPIESDIPCAEAGDREVVGDVVGLR